MQNTKITAIQVGSDTNLESLGVLTKTLHTTNMDYLGSDSDGVPVYLNSKLQKGEIRKIMATEYKNLKPGYYECQVRQVIRKNGKDANGNEDSTKKLIIIELDVKGQENYEYITFFEAGYSDKQMEISKDNIDRILDDFQIDIIDDLVGKEAQLSAKQKGEYINLYLNPTKVKFDWNKVFQFGDGESIFPCTIKKFYKTKTGDKYNFIVDIKLNDTISCTEYVCYDMENEYRKDGFERALKRLEITLDQLDQDLDLACKVKVKKVTKDGQVYINKKLVFDRPKVEHYWKKDSNANK